MATDVMVDSDADSAQSKSLQLLGYRGRLKLPLGETVVAIYVPCDSFWGVVAAFLLGQIHATLMIYGFLHAVTGAGGHGDWVIPWYLLCFLLAQAMYVICSERITWLLQKYGLRALLPSSGPESAKALLAGGAAGGFAAVLAGHLPLPLPAVPQIHIVALEIAVFAFCWIVACSGRNTPHAAGGQEWWSHCTKSTTLHEANLRHVRSAVLIVCIGGAILAVALLSPKLLLPFMFPLGSTLALWGLVFLLTLGRGPADNPHPPAYLIENDG